MISGLNMAENTNIKRVISEKKVNKNEEVHIKSLDKFIEKHGKELTDDLRHNILLIGDSKVRHLESEMTARTNISCFWRKGAKLDNNVLRKHIDRHILRHQNPTVFLFFSTCYLTEVVDKKKGLIDLVGNSEDIVNIIIEKYTQFKQEKLYMKSTARILYLECPYYSIVAWNSSRKHPQPEIFENNQERLESLITELNIRIRELNLPYNPPHLSQDMRFKIKKKKNHSQTYFLSYKVLKKDGIHPDRKISKLWLIRINNFATTLDN